MTSLTHEDVTQTLRLIDELPDGELILTKGELSLTIRKGLGGGTSIAPAPTAAAIPLAAAPITPAPVARPPVAVPATDMVPDVPPAGPSTASPGGAVQRSPMMGTFYRSASPGEPPLVEIGTKVAVGDALCLVEVMKLFNSLTADTAGTITAIHVQDGDMVDTDTPLFSIQPG